MTARRPSTNIFMVAFAAIVGMLSFADVASACSTKPVPAPRACCAVRPPGECGCCGESRTLPSSPQASRLDAIVSSSAGIALQAPTPSCECRASEPAAPTERPAQRTGTDRTDVERGETLAALSLVVRPAPAPAHRLLPNESPPKSPLYLRTSRLLI